MENRHTHISNELPQVAPFLATLGRQLPFEVPKGYFEDFPDRMLQMVQQSANNEVPDGYFESFALQMLQKVRSEEVRHELEGVAPLLNGLPKTMPHSLPEGYFEQWQPAINRPEAPKAAKIIPVSGSFHWKRWAAAAAIIISLGVGWQVWFSNRVPQQQTASVQPALVDTLLSEIDASSLTGYLETEQVQTEFTKLLTMANLDVETGVKQLSTEELSWYLENQSVSIPGT